ncbi:MAG: hypothetical protein JW722_03415 [Demequinaceae bacterium]|nr:hypothetical protein [Demequinaceae bacterium]
MTTAVILAVRGTGEAALAKAIEAQADLVVARRCADLVEAVAAAAAGVGGVVVIHDQPRLDRAIVRSLTRHNVAVIGIPSGPDEAKRWLSLGVGTVTSVGAGVDEVVAAVMESISEPLDEPDSPSIHKERGGGTVVAVWGPTGAPGRTTLAVNLASEMTRLAGSVILLDADTYGGAVSQALGMLDEAPGIAAVARIALDGGPLSDAIRRHSLEVQPGLRVLSGMSQASRWRELPSAAVEPILAAVRFEAAVSIVDCGFGIEGGDSKSGGAGRDDATLSVLSGADLIVVIGSADPLGIQRLVRSLGDLADGPAGPIPRKVVVNRVRASVCGARPAQAVGDALARYAGVREAWAIPDDPKACDAATLAGQTLSERAPRSPVRKAVEALARTVWEEATAGRTEEAAAVLLGA